MAAYFCDASAVVKRYVQETGTAWVRGLVDPAAGHRFFVARITGVEVTSAVIRRARGGSLTQAEAAAILPQFRKDFATGYGMVEVSPTMLKAAMQMAELHGLRAYDAVQLAAAMELHASRTAAGLASLILVSADQELNTAAAANGLLVENPNLHP
jgi:predicted nucleic acid-binding protein